MGEPDAKREDDEIPPPPESGVGRISDDNVEERYVFVDQFSQLLANFEAEGTPHPDFEQIAIYDANTGDVVLRHRKRGISRIRYDRFRRALGRVVSCLADAEKAKLQAFLTKYGI